MVVSGALAAAGNGPQSALVAGKALQHPVYPPAEVCVCLSQAFLPGPSVGLSWNSTRGQQWYLDHILMGLHFLLLIAFAHAGCNFLGWECFSARPRCSALLGVGAGGTL